VKNPYRAGNRRACGFSHLAGGGGFGMYMIPIGSRQIPYVQYDDEAAQILVQYSTGRTEAVANVNREDVSSLLASPNRYDWIVRLKRRTE
jgi:hypothetical protein